MSEIRRKRLDRPSQWLAVGLALFAAGCSTATTTVRQHPELDAAVARIQTVAILPVDVGQLRKTAFAGDELQLDRERAIGRDLVKTLKSALRSKSYSVVTEPELWPGDEAPPETPESIQLRSACAALESSLGTSSLSPEEAGQLRVNVGPVARAVASQQKADALLVVRYSGFDKSGGLQTMEIVTSALIAGATGVQGGPISRSAGEIRLFLVGAGGDVLWTNRLAGPTDRKRGAMASRGYFGPADLASKSIAPLPSRVSGP